MQMSRELMEITARADIDSAVSRLLSDHAFAKRVGGGLDRTVQRWSPLDREPSE